MFWNRKQKIDSSDPQNDPNAVADIFERYLDGRSLYPQEWNDLIERGHKGPAAAVLAWLDAEQWRISGEDGKVDQQMVQQLRQIIHELRSTGTAAVPDGYPSPD